MQSSSDSIKLLQITDTHLFAADEGSLLSVKTADSFNAVVADVLRRNVTFDYILATGDISQDHSAESYQRFAEGIEPLEKDCFWLPGNHDYKPNMGSVLPSQQIKAAEHVWLGAHWQLVLLDSQVVGVPHGRLSDQQLALLEEKLAEHPERHTLVLLHHHPLLVGSAWLDQHTLKDAEAFWQVVDRFDNVKGILCGHVHQDMNVLHNGIRVMATPSTCVQFKPNSDDFALDTTSPGWRELQLHACGDITTQVGRLPDGQFQPDFSSNGY
ncbi:3',5'-cyclic-AMP phosphodiesterase [Vibrio diabolicus]|uniref:3',5'-cyclic-AMP phosphodiesterase n=1 Tax=Vibrio diabolicus TaxID=50719 RepID=UPI00215E3C31|nr:3',5'-cyclic-AMP phosphodiesterase [Vibrio diabolicus]MCS0378249.1 3',5'-cyclic-AMP phosphodiesterase [Vibrio diabolicus]MCS0422022.1 3',5'-cyclic-AMP phosphodiesterase [Vibrio diabolicus]